VVAAEAACYDSSKPVRLTHRRLACLAAVWLCCQLAFVASPFALDQSWPSNVTAIEEEQTNRSPITTDCVMNGTCLPSDVGLLSLATGAGPLPAIFTLHDQPLTSPVPAPLVAAQTRLEWPDSPPPRF
jgi:hypothetical protein